MAGDGHPIHLAPYPDPYKTNPFAVALRANSCGCFVYLVPMFSGNGLSVREQIIVAAAYRLILCPKSTPGPISSDIGSVEEIGGPASKCGRHLLERAHGYLVFSPFDVADVIFGERRQFRQLLLAD